MKLKELMMADLSPEPSDRPESSHYLLIPDHDQEGEVYPGNIKPGYYNGDAVARLIIYHVNNPNALQFIADMMENGDKERDIYVKWLRKNKNNKIALKKMVSDFKANI